VLVIALGLIALATILAGGPGSGADPGGGIAPVRPRASWAMLPLFGRRIPGPEAGAMDALSRRVSGGGAKARRPIRRPLAPPGPAPSFHSPSK